MATDNQSPAAGNTKLGGPELPKPVRTDVTLRRAATQPTDDQALWAAIRNRTNAIGFPRYAQFINRLLCAGQDNGPPANWKNGADLSNAGDIGSPSISDRLTDLANRPSIYGGDAYQLLKLATQAFLLFECGVVIRPPRKEVTGMHESISLHKPDELDRDESASTFELAQNELVAYLTRDIGFGGAERLPYLKRIASTLLAGDSQEKSSPYCNAVLQHRLSCPSMIELIWSYWHEQGMLVQTINTIALRFQNRRNGQRDPLVNLELDPLRPLNNLMWGYLQDEPNRLTVMRRAYEYDHQYGLVIQGKAVAELASVDSRSKFIEAFHNLLHRTAAFYQEDADTTIVSDGFPLLNALKEVHMVLAEGAHNQFGDLPWTARAEMLTTQWLLARPELREFLRGRAMVPYREAWMGQVDTMKRMQGWSDVGINHFRDLGTFGEQLLLSVRYGDWIAIDNQEHARNWARSWKPEVQSYIHSYLAVTGVDLAADITDTRDAAVRYMQPSTLLHNRIAAQQGSSSVRFGAAQPELLAAPQMPALTMPAAPGAARPRLLTRRLGN
jgi:hypothetical protein